MRFGTFVGKAVDVPEGSSEEVELAHGCERADGSGYLARLMQRRSCVLIHHARVLRPHVKSAAITWRWA